MDQRDKKMLNNSLDSIAKVADGLATEAEQLKDRELKRGLLSSAEEILFTVADMRDTIARL